MIDDPCVLEIRSVFVGIVIGKEKVVDDGVYSFILADRGFWGSGVLKSVSHPMMNNKKHVNDRKIAISFLIMVS